MSTFAGLVRARAARKRQSPKDRAAKASATKDASRLAKHQERLARHAGREITWPATVTPTETRNVRRGPMRPKETTSIASAVARTETPIVGCLTT